MKPASERRSLDPEALAQLFLEARSPNSWTDTPVDEALLRRVYELARLGPTSVNSNPARFVWVRSPQAKERLASLASDRNQRKILEAPVTAIIAHDLAFADRMDVLFPHDPTTVQEKAWDVEWRDSTAFRNGTLQGAYLIIAARALGLDCGPLSGFDNAAVDAEFLSDRPHLRSNFLCCVGYGASRYLFPRLPRFSFEDANDFV